MCFNSKLNEKAKKTTEDIVCFKILKDLKRGLSSPIRKKAPVWHLGQVVDDSKKFQKKANRFSVDEGIHALRTLTDAKNYKQGMSTRAKIYVARIPAGSLVYKNNTQYCSNKLVVEGEVVTKKKK